MSAVEVIRFQPQPEFPVEDINEPNAAMASYYLTTAVERKAYLQTYHHNLQVMHNVGNAALVEAGVNPGNSGAEYMAFCRGFTSLNYLATLVDSRPFLQIANGTGMQHFYLDHEVLGASEQHFMAQQNTFGFADYELHKRRPNWLQTHQNTLDLMREESDRNDETPKQFTARILGAQVASELLFVA